MGDDLAVRIRGFVAGDVETVVAHRAALACRVGRSPDRLRGEVNPERWDRAGGDGSVLAG